MHFFLRPQQQLVYVPLLCIHLEYCVTIFFSELDINTVITDTFISCPKSKNTWFPLSRESVGNLEIYNPPES